MNKEYVMIAKDMKNNKVAIIAVMNELGYLSTSENGVMADIWKDQLRSGSYPIADEWDGDESCRWINDFITYMYDRTIDEWIKAANDESSGVIKLFEIGEYEQPT